MLKLLPVEGKPGLARDPNINFVHNINSATEIEMVRSRKKLLKASKQDTEQLKRDISDMQSEMKDIKSLLNQILEQL